MHPNTFTTLLCSLALSLVLAAPSSADPPADKGLSGDKRRHYIDDCLQKQAYGGSQNTYGEPRGKDVLGKGAKDH